MVKQFNTAPYVNQMPIFEWYMGRCGFVNGHQKVKYSKEIGSHASNFLIIRGSLVNIVISETYMIIQEEREFSLWRWIWAQEIMRKMAMTLIWIWIVAMSLDHWIESWLLDLDLDCGNDSNLDLDMELWSFVKGSASSTGASRDPRPTFAHSRRSQQCIWEGKFKWFGWQRLLSNNWSFEGGCENVTCYMTGPDITRIVEKCKVASMRFPSEALAIFGFSLGGVSVSYIRWVHLLWTPWAIKNM